MGATVGLIPSTGGREERTERGERQREKEAFFEQSRFHNQKKMISFYFILCLFHYHSEHESEVYLYSISESTVERIMCLEKDLVFLPRKSSCSSSSHACKNSLAKKIL